MTIENLYSALNYVNHSRAKRKEMSALILNNPDMVMPLMDIAFTIDDPIASRACWVLEFASKENLSCIFPYIDHFTQNIGKVYQDASVRPMAKICEYLTTSYFSPLKNETQKVLTSVHLERITSVCFDWLIGDHKVAAKAYSMKSLLLLGTKYSWIHPELKLILEQNYSKGSAAYKARARMTLSAIKG